jgi:hypothetical protein
MVVCNCSNSTQFASLQENLLILKPFSSALFSPLTPRSIPSSLSCQGENEPLISSGSDSQGGVFCFGESENGLKLVAHSAVKTLNSRAMTTKKKVLGKNLKKGPHKTKTNKNVPS